MYITDPDQFFPLWHYVPLQRIDQLAAGSVAILEQKGAPALREYLTHLPEAASSARLTARRTSITHTFSMEKRDGNSRVNAPTATWRN